MITEKDLKPGIKVKIPKTKSAIDYGSIEDSTAIQGAKEKNQDYLFYIGKNLEDGYYILWHTFEDEFIGGGDFFTLEDIELYENDFVLPQEWFVRATEENRDCLRTWRQGDYTNWEDNLCMLSDRYWSTCSHTIKSNYVEISFEQFKEYVLKTKDKETNMEQMKTALPRDNYGIRVENNAREIVEYLKLEHEFIGNAENSSVYYYNNGRWTCSSSKNVPCGIKVFTLEEFKILKQMESKSEKEIVGYKLIKPEYEQAVKEITKFGNFDFIKGKNNHGYIVSPPTEKSESTVCFDKLSEAGVLDIWFEPIFEDQKYKIGDWVLLKGIGSGNGVGDKAEVVVKLLPLQSGLNGNIDPDFAFRYKSALYGTRKEYIIRKATPEEIQAVAERHIDLGHNRIVLVNLNGIFAEGKQIQYKHINNLYYNTKTFGDTGWRFQCNSFDIGCWKHLKREDLKLILDAYEEINGKPE